MSCQTVGSETLGAWAWEGPHFVRIEAAMFGCAGWNGLEEGFDPKRLAEPHLGGVIVDGRVVIIRGGCARDWYR